MTMIPRTQGDARDAHETKWWLRGVQRDDVMCRVQRLEYDFEARTGYLYLPPHNCVDMTGCIDLFTALDPDVQHIRTMAGRREDTGYLRGADGEWHSYAPAWRRTPR